MKRRRRHARSIASTSKKNKQKMEFGSSTCCHFQLCPFSPGAAPQGLQIAGSVARGPGKLLLTYSMAGDLDRIVLAEPAQCISRRHELWRRTCFEAFFAIPGQTAYWEGNFSSSGDWNLYRFTDYRQGMREEQRPDQPLCHAVAGKSRLEVSCELDIHDLCSDLAVISIGLACVVLETNGRLSYWAIDHNGAARPDFHDRRGFLLQLAPSGSLQDAIG